MDAFLPFIGAELTHSLVLDDVDWDMQMDEFLPFTGAELAHSPVLGQADGSGRADGRVSPLQENSYILLSLGKLFSLRT